MEEYKVLKDALKMRNKNISWLSKKSGVSKELIKSTIKEHRPICKEHAILLAKALRIDPEMITSNNEEIDKFWSKSNEILFQIQRYKDEVLILDGITKCVLRFAGIVIDDKDYTNVNEWRDEYYNYLRRKQDELYKKIAKLEKKNELPVSKSLSDMEIEHLRWLAYNTSDKNQKEALEHAIKILENI